MRKVWKWIIGIVLGLIILALLVGVGFLVRNSFGVFHTQTRAYRSFEPRGPEMMPFNGFGYHMGGPGMMGFGYSPFGGFFGLLFMLGFLVLVVLGIVWIVRQLSGPKVINGSMGTSASASTTLPAGTSEPAPSAELNPCKKCGRPLQADWSVCPYCGKKV